MTERRRNRWITHPLVLLGVLLGLITVVTLALPPAKADVSFELFCGGGPVRLAP